MDSELIENRLREHEEFLKSTKLFIINQIIDYCGSKGRNSGFDHLCGNKKGIIKELADKAGIAYNTLLRIANGDPTLSISVERLLSVYKVIEKK